MTRNLSLDAQVRSTSVLTDWGKPLKSGLGLESTADEQTAHPELKFSQFSSVFLEKKSESIIFPALLQSKKSLPVIVKEDAIRPVGLFNNNLTLNRHLKNQNVDSSCFRRIELKQKQERFSKMLEVFAFHKESKRNLSNGRQVASLQDVPVLTTPGKNFQEVKIVSARHNSHKKYSQ